MACHVLWCGIIGVSVSMKGKNKMINKQFCKRLFENYLDDCGLDTSYWDCDEAAEMILYYLTAPDFVLSLRFAYWPMSVRSQIVCSTVLRTFDTL